MFLVTQKINKLVSMIQIQELLEQSDEFFVLVTFPIKNYYRKKKLIKKYINLLTYKEYIKGYATRLGNLLEEKPQCLMLYGNILESVLEIRQKQLLILIIKQIINNCLIIIIKINYKYNGCKLKKLKRKKIKRAVPTNNVYIYTKTNFAY